ncbi:MAG TPA: hypothetical protein VKZ63_02445, partial [Kofleriaceae bacterium]|nr:hypothetical protein [Kofleriaceae bacterium]
HGAPPPLWTATPPPGTATAPPPWPATPPPGTATAPPPWPATPPPGTATAPPPWPATPPPGTAAALVPDDSIPAPPPPDGEQQPAPAVWRQAHPSARRWAERRQRTAGPAGHRAPSPPRIALGLFIAGLGVWLLISVLPDRRPISAVELARISQQAGVDASAWRFSRSLYPVARGLAALYLTVGFLVALRGLLFRRRLEVVCRRCGRAVFAERSGATLRCEGGPHPAGLNRSAIALAAAFALVSGALLILIAAASLAG